VTQRSFVAGVYFCVQFILQSEAWSNDHLREHAKTEIGRPARCKTPDRSLALQAIKYYQSEMGSRSIDRCPFAISCSNYASTAIRQSGFVSGVTLFIDRNLYRENAGSQRYYVLEQTETRGRRLNDRFYLFGNPVIARFGTSDTHPRTRTNASFADFLFGLEEHDRAATEYLRLLHAGTPDSVRTRLQIARCMGNAGRYVSATLHASVALRSVSATPEERDIARVILGQCAMASKDVSVARYYFAVATESDSLKVGEIATGWLAVALHQWTSSKRIFSAIVATENRETDLKTTANEVIRLSRQGELLNLKSPPIAGALSFLIPGAGQAYSNHTYDAIHAFLYVTSLAIATYGIYRYESNADRNLGMFHVALPVFTLFHAANVVGGYRTAQYRNWRIQQSIVDEVEPLVSSFLP
jgi:putative component of membrane protein insertase Oxa1/YidC/SpoIIIJ protein YidD